jgi:hypothetical protein
VFLGIFDGASSGFNVTSRHKGEEAEEGEEGAAFSMPWWTGNHLFVFFSVFCEDWLRFDAQDSQGTVYDVCECC